MWPVLLTRAVTSIAVSAAIKVFWED